MSTGRHRVSPEVAFAALLEQMQTLAKELLLIRERAHADDLDFVADQINSLRNRLIVFKRLMRARMESFERRLSRPPDRDWIEDGLELFEEEASKLSEILSAVREELEEKHYDFTQVLGAFQDEVRARLETFSTSVRGRTA